MFRNRLYYHIKPLLPVSVRMTVRRWFALRQRDRVKDRWPILPGSEQPPQGWPGWPDGKKFAFVLTHDVEGPAGLAKCRQLMELEQRLGFRSSFNFIPEGEYRVTREFRDELTRNGFEVGVHDLHHDGKLFRNRREFAGKARRINQYLKDWGAAGFRSGFMLHNLEWLHDLEVRYDASTFDTDPFEPQPQGRHTIFPFWVPGTGPLETTDHGQQTTSGQSVVGGQRAPARSGYVELPYTLPQDSSLFLLFGEHNTDIWLQKLDWIAGHGGMALVNVHPDYIRFAGEPVSKRTYPVEAYIQLLEYVRKRFGQSYWQPLPREVAAFVAPLKLPLRQKPKRVCMVSYSFYRSDARVTRYAETLAARGDEVDVLALRRSPEQPTQETISNVNLFRIQSRYAKTEKSRLSYLLPLLRFLFASSFVIARRHTCKRYDLLHIHNVPDFLVFSAAYPRLAGARVILDIHDIVPEFFACKFGAPEDSWSIRMLKWIERASAAFAHRVIISNHFWLTKYAARTGADGKCSVFINNVDGRIFRPRPRTRNDGKFIILFPGGLQWHQGLDIAIRAFQQVSARFPNAEFHIYGDGNMKADLMALTKELGLDGKVRFFNGVTVREIAEVMANADLGVVPKRADSFGNEAYSTKIMEFMALGIPVVIANTRIDRYYFDDTVVRFFEAGNPDALAGAMIEVLSDPEMRRQMAARALIYAARNSWESRKDDYLKLVDDLCVKQ